VGLLLSARRTGHIDRQRRAPGAAARRLAANAGSVMLTAAVKLTKLNTDWLGLFLFIVRYFLCAAVTVFL